MTHSFMQQTELTCSHCDQTFQVDVWLIVDAEERPDLVERIKTGTLNDVVCPYCGEEMGQVDAPLLLFRPNATHVLLFSPAEESTVEQDQDHAVGLLDHLRESLGQGWLDEWLADGLNGLPRSALPMMLSDAPRDAMRQWVKAGAESMPGSTPLQRALVAFLLADSWDESREVLEAHPELLSKEVEGMLDQLVDAAQERDDENAEAAFSDHRDILRRCQEIGVEATFDEIWEAENAQPLSEQKAMQAVLEALPPQVRGELEWLVMQATPDEFQATLDERPDLMAALQQAAADVARKLV